MAFPTNPTNGQQANVNGVVYTYNSSKAVWAVTTTFTGNILVDQINSNAIVSAGNVSGNSINGAAISVSGNVSGANFNGTAISVTNIAGTLSTAAQPNVTSVGSLSSLSVVGTTTTSNKITTVYAGGANLTNATNMLEIQDTGTPSIPSMAFHRPGVYASKISFNTDNMFYFGGWSAGAGASPIVCGGAFPGATGTYDLGSAALRWRNIYTNDLQLSNGIGDYTIVEGEEDLFLYNNKTKKTFKFALIEVDPSTVPPKAKTDQK